jgi:hypothetical protein
MVPKTTLPPTLFTHFADMEDPRTGPNASHKFIDIMVITIWVRPKSVGKWSCGQFQFGGWLMRVT